ncbi:MAG: response regulator transcription factor [Anaerolineales bacterium]|nr:response regulator transcription factor [Anaerolineales bacterium]
MSKLRVLIVDDHPMMREAIRAAIEVDSEIEVVGEAEDGVTAVERVCQLQPDITIMDLFLPGQDGIQAIVAILQDNPQARILVLTSSNDDQKLRDAIEAGVIGYLVKDTGREELLQAIREVGRGNPYLPPAVMRKLIAGLRQPRPPADPPAATLPSEPLTIREKEVLQLLGQGFSNQKIAEMLQISQGTVRVHVHNILGKLNLESRSQAIIYALREN